MSFSEAGRAWSVGSVAAPALRAAASEIYVDTHYCEYCATQTDHADDGSIIECLVCGTRERVNDMSIEPEWNYD